MTNQLASEKLLRELALSKGNGLPTAVEMYAAVQEALRMFGEYSFTDKGPEEVMEIDGLAERLKRADAPAAPSC